MFEPMADDTCPSGSLKVYPDTIAQTGRGRHWRRLLVVGHVAMKIEAHLRCTHRRTAASNRSCQIDRAWRRTAQWSGKGRRGGGRAAGGRRDGAIFCGGASAVMASTAGGSASMASEHGGEEGLSIGDGEGGTA